MNFMAFKNRYYRRNYIAFSLLVGSLSLFFQVDFSRVFLWCIFGFGMVCFFGFPIVLSRIPRNENTLCLTPILDVILMGIFGTVFLSGLLLDGASGNILTWLLIASVVLLLSSTVRLIQANKKCSLE